MRAVVALVCLIAAPLGLWAAGKMNNPPGNGPGAGQVIVGAGIPLALALGAARAGGLSWREARLWAAVALTLTGLLLVFAAVVAAQID